MKRVLHFVFDFLLVAFLVFGAVGVFLLCIGTVLGIPLGFIYCAALLVRVAWR